MEESGQSGEGMERHEAARSIGVYMCASALAVQSVPSITVNYKGQSGSGS